MTTLSRVFPKRHAGSQGFDALALGMGATGMWPLRETNGTVAEDLSGNSYDGTYENTPTLGVKMTRPPFIAGITRGVTFNGTNERVNLDSHLDNFAALAACTVCLQFNAAGAASNRVLFSLNDISNSTDFWRLERRSSGNLIRCVIADGGAKLSLGSAAITAGTSCFLAFAGDGSGNEMWLDGVKATAYGAGFDGTAAGFNQVAGISEENSDSMRIGNILDSIAERLHWSGDIWNVAVFPSRLTTAQLNTLYLATVYGG